MAKSKKSTKKAVKEVKKVALSKCDHRLNSQSGFIDQQLEAGKSASEIERLWNKEHPGNKMKPGRIKGHLQHLIEKHGFSQNLAKQFMAANKVAKKSKSKS